MKLFLGMLVGLMLSIGIAAGAAFAICEGSFGSECFGKDVHIGVSDHDHDYDHDDDDDDD